MTQAGIVGVSAERNLHAARVCEVCVRLPGVLVSPQVSVEGEGRPAADADAPWSRSLERLSLPLLSS